MELGIGGIAMDPPANGTKHSPAHRSSVPLRLVSLQRYGLAVLSVGTALGLSLLLQHFHFRASPAVLLFAVAISSWCAGRGPGMLAATLSIISIYWYFVEPVRTIYIYWSEIPYFISLAALAVLLSWFGAVRRRIETELRERADLLNLTHDTVFVMDMDGVIKYWNRGAEEQYGWSAEEAQGKVVHDLLKTVFPFPLDQIKAEVTRSGRWEGELLHTKKDGSQLVAASRWSLKRDDRGEPAAILETNNDITERKRAEEGLRRNEAYLAEAQRLSHTGSWAFDLASNKYLYVSEECLRIFEADSQESLPDRKAVSRLICPEDWDRVNRDFENSVREKTDTSSEFRIVVPSGAAKRVQAIRHPVLNEAGDVVGFVGTVIDVTDRRRAEEALRLSNAYNRSLIEASVDPLVTIGPDGKITDVNAATEAATGRSRRELIGTDFCDYFTAPAKARVGYERAFREGMVRDYPLELRHRDGHVISVLYNASVYRDESGHVIGVFAAARDITERKRAEEALRESEMRFRTFVDHAADAFFMLNEQGTIIDCNRCACESLGYTREELIGMNPMVFDVNLDAATIEAVAERTAVSETVVFDRHWHRRKDGSQFPVDVLTSVFWHGGRRFLLKVARDISDLIRADEERERLRELEADLRHLNRVSMMGELAASIAHEVNQPLSGIVSNASASLRFLSGDAPNLEEVREAVYDIVRDGKRAGEIIARIRTLTKRTAGPREKLDLNEIIREVLALVDDEARRKNVIARTQFADDLSLVAGDRVQLQQVVLNLVMNAIEAMSNTGERARELVITTRNIDADHVQATVEDSGTGLDPNKIDKIFDSFYTTKPGGMGMGLSISRSILQAHGGQLWAEGKDEPGTVFHFTVPKYQEEGLHAGATGN